MKHALNTRVQAVLFDLDGTLADTAPDLARALNRVRAAQGLAPMPLEATRSYTSSGARGLLKVGFGMNPDDEGYEALKLQFLDFYAAEICVDTRLFDGMDELLDQLDQDRLPWGVVTNKAERFTHPLLQGLRLGVRAACVVGGDTAPRAKPYPDPLLHAAAALQLPPAACLYVGDDVRDVQAARAAGMRVLAAKYGYLGDGGAIESWQADAVIEHPRQVLDYL
ncbi:MAG TPA: HAD-IA family hydrolase [Burkholderiales bacterium]|nr:HAD-IA family hydrolase [Burkholderiales bacterium]